jgi:hypothetical protein
VDTTTWPRVEVRILKKWHRPRPVWGEWNVVAVVKEITAAKHLAEWYHVIDKDELEARVVVWQLQVLEEGNR